MGDKMEGFLHDHESYVFRFNTRDSDSGEESQKMFSRASCQSGTFKRKRHLSETSSEDECDIENLPTNEEKKHKDDNCVQEASCSFEREGEERAPFSELKRVSSGSVDSHMDCLVSDHERLSLSDDDEEPKSNSSSYYATGLSELSPEAITDETLSCALSPASHTSNTYCRRTDVELRALERTNPLPMLEWADLHSLWELMCKRDDESVKFRDPNVFARHPNLTPRMRTVLLDWILEVCEVYHMHRETYYMTMDYIDRFLSSLEDLPKQQLQLIGITCLQLANKNEEVYPPKMAEFAYVTDGACSVKQIIDKELIVCSVLEWRLNPVTPIYWLKLYLQIMYHGKARHNYGFYFPQFSPKMFIRASHLLDLCTLDMGCLRFSYSVLAATAFYLAIDTKHAALVSGLEEDDLRPCIFWMTPFWGVLKQEVPEYAKTYQKLPQGCNTALMYENEFNLQYHLVSLTLLDRVSDEMSKGTSCVMTPPSSNKKPVPQEQTPFP